MSSQLRHESTIGKKLVKQQCLLHMPPQYMLSFGPIAAEIVSLVWSTPANFNRFRVLAALLHGTPVLGVSQTLWRWTEGATYIRPGGHHVGQWPTFLVCLVVRLLLLSFYVLHDFFIFFYFILFLPVRFVCVLCTIFITNKKINK